MNSDARARPCPRPRRRQTILRCLFGAAALAVLVMSLLPPTPALPSTGWDKSNHLLGFSVLGVLGWLAFPRHRLAMVGGLLAYGALIELLQSLTPTRQADWQDWVADAAGVLLGCSAMAAWPRRRPAGAGQTG